MTLGTSQLNPGMLVNYQIVILVTWLGMAVLTVLGAALLLWRTRRKLAQVRQDHDLTRVPFPPATSPAPIASPTSSSIAS